MNKDLHNMAQELYPEENWGTEKDVNDNIDKHVQAVNDNINTHNVKMTFGKHQGELITRVPLGYLEWMVNEMEGERKALAEAELKRRGTSHPEIDVSGHAVNRASISCGSIWRKDCKKKEGYESSMLLRNISEGLHTWLCRVSKEAYDKNETDHAGRYLHKGMKFVIEKKGEWPIVKTIMLDKEK